MVSEYTLQPSSLLESFCLFVWAPRWQPYIQSIPWRHQSYWLWAVIWTTTRLGISTFRVVTKGTLRLKKSALLFSSLNALNHLRKMPIYPAFKSSTFFKGQSVFFSHDQVYFQYNWKLFLSFWVSLKMNYKTLVPLYAIKEYEETVGSLTTMFF